MRLATIDLHSHKVQTQLYRVPKFGVNRPNSKQDTLKMSKCAKKCKAIRTLSEHSVRMATHFFVNFDVFKSLYLGQN